MNVAERVRYLRKDLLHLTMEQFGEKLGVGKTAISKIENGERGLTDQMVRSISREFKANPDWLRNGDGDPLLVIGRNEEIADFIGTILRDEPDGPKVKLISALAKMDQSGWDLLVKLAEEMTKENEQISDDPPA